MKTTLTTQQIIIGFNKNFSRVWEQLLKIPGNDICCDCGNINPKWASINLGITLCIGKLHTRIIYIKYYL